MFRGEYTVDEPETPLEHGGFEVPRGGDEELLEMIQGWQGRNASTVALEYNDRGEHLLESFLERHVADLPDGGQKLRLLINSLDAFGERYADSGGESGMQNKMQHMLSTQVIPLVKSVLRHESRKMQAHGRPDFIPGAASEARDERVLAAKQNVSAAVLSNITGMNEYGVVDALQNKSRLKNLSPQEELHMHSASLKLLQRQLIMWNQANQEHQGNFNSTITRLQREIRATEKKVNFTMQEIHGMGSKARSRKHRGIDRSMGRPSMLMIQENRDTREMREREEFLAMGAHNAMEEKKEQEREDSREKGHRCAFRWGRSLAPM